MKLKPTSAVKFFADDNTRNFRHRKADSDQPLDYVAGRKSSFGPTCYETECGIVDRAAIKTAVQIIDKEIAATTWRGKNAKPNRNREILRARLGLDDVVEAIKEGTFVPFELKPIEALAKEHEITGRRVEAIIINALRGKVGKELDKQR